MTPRYVPYGSFTIFFMLNGLALEADFRLLTFGRTSESVNSTNTVIGDPDLIFIEEGAHVTELSSILMPARFMWGATPKSWKALCCAALSRCASTRW